MPRDRCVCIHGTKGIIAGPVLFVPRWFSPLTKAQFVSIVREALRELGLPQEQFVGHSFRIGATTAAGKSGLEDSTIMMLGGWNSTAFLWHIRTPWESLTLTTAQLSLKVNTPSRAAR